VPLINLSCNFINVIIQRKQQSIKVQLCHTMPDEECLHNNNILMKAKILCLPKQHFSVVKINVLGYLPISSLPSYTQNPWFLIPNNKVNSNHPLKQETSCDPKTFLRMTKNQHTNVNALT